MRDQAKGFHRHSGPENTRSLAEQAVESTWYDHSLEKKRKDNEDQPAFPPRDLQTSCKACVELAEKVVKPRRKQKDEEETSKEMADLRLKQDLAVKSILEKCDQLAAEASGPLSHEASKNQEKIEADHNRWGEVIYQIMLMDENCLSFAQGFKEAMAGDKVLASTHETSNRMKNPTTEEILQVAEILR